MKQVTRAEWAEALRSGKYNQCQGSLYNAHSNGFCCLGVLGALAGGQPSGEESLLFSELCEARSGYVPDIIARMVGLGDHMQSKLSGMNDRGISFKEIADFIEKLPEDAEANWMNINNET